MYRAASSPLANSKMLGSVGLAAAFRSIVMLQPMGIPAKPLQPYSLKRRLLRGEEQPVLRKGVSATGGGSPA